MDVCVDVCMDVCVDVCVDVCMDDVKELKINIGRLHCVQEKTPTFVLIVTVTLAFIGRFLSF